jgi:hypothetical protein
VLCGLFGIHSGQMRLANFFKGIFVINLPERVDRRREIVAELARAGVENSRVEIFPGIRPTEAAGFPGIGARGCFLSHLGVLKEAKRRNIAPVLILEDDLMLSRKLLEAQDSLVSVLEHQDWGFVYLGHVVDVGPVDGVSLRPYDEGVMTAHFYGVSASVRDALIEYLELVLTRQPGDPLGGPMHVDGAFSMFRAQHPEIKTLLAYPSLGGQRSLRSDISEGNWYNKLPFLQPLVARARAAKTLIKRLRS